MGHFRPSGQLTTHEVTNQVPPLEGDNLWLDDAVLREGVIREGGHWAVEQLTECGARFGSVQTREWGDQANRNLPNFNCLTGMGIGSMMSPAYHQVMGLAMELGVHSVAWTAAKGGHVVQRRWSICWRKSRQERVVR